MSKISQKPPGFKVKDGTFICENVNYMIDDHKAVCVIVHGMGSHSGRWEEFAKFLNENGFSAYLYDVRGMGRSSGPRVNPHSFDQYIGDLEVILKTRVKNNGAPIFIIAESLGTLQTHYLELKKGLRKVNKDVAGFASIGIPGEPSECSLKIQSFIIGLIVLICPCMKIDKALAKSDMSRDEEVVKGYSEDDLMVWSGPRARFACAFLASYRFCYANLSKMEIPVRYFHGTDDKVFEWDTITKKVFKQVGSKDKSVKIYEGGYHDLLHDIKKTKDEVFKDIVEWLDEKTGKKKKKEEEESESEEEEDKKEEEEENKNKEEEEVEVEEVTESETE